MERARERAARRDDDGEAPRQAAAKGGLWERVTRWVNLATLVSFGLYVASGLALAKAGLLTLEHVRGEPPILLWPTLTATAVLVLAQLAVNGFDALVRLWDREVGPVSVGLVLLGPCTGGTSSFSTGCSSAAGRWGDPRRADRASAPPLRRGSGPRRSPSQIDPKCGSVN